MPSSFAIFFALLSASSAKSILPSIALITLLLVFALSFALGSEDDNSLTNFCDSGNILSSIDNCAFKALTNLFKSLATDNSILSLANSTLF